MSEAVGSALPYDDAPALRQRMFDVSPTLVRFDVHEPTSAPLVGIQQLVAGSTKPAIGGVTGPFRLPISDFYQTDPISRASVTMARASERC